MVAKECTRWLSALVLVLCVVFPKVNGGKIIFPESSSPSESPDETPEDDGSHPESRGLWESDLFFLQKLSGLFGGGDEDERQKPTRKVGLRPEHLPPQLLFTPNRRVGAGHRRPQPVANPQQHAPYFRLPFGAQPPPPPPQDSKPQPSQNVLAIHLPPPPQPPPSPSSSHVTISPIEPASKFPYEFVRPIDAKPAISSQLRPPVDAPPLFNIPPPAPSTKPVPPKPIRPKKPAAFGSPPDLVGAHSINRKPQLSLPVRPRPPQQLQQLGAKPAQRLPQQVQQLGAKPVQRLPQLPVTPETRPNLPHPRPAPQPQKQHPRPPPQPQRVILQPEKPTAIQKKPIHPDFKPSPQEGSVMADAFQPVFVASPSMDELGNDIMKPMHVASKRTSITTTTTSAPELLDFF